MVRTATMRPNTVLSERRTGPAALIYLEKIRLGTSYVDVVERIRQVVQDEALGNEKRRPVTITAGTGERSSGGIYYVSKVDLMAGLRTSLELKGLEFGEGLTEWKEFRKQMLGFGGTAKDDLVLAVALAAWGAKVGRSTARNRTEYWWGRRGCTEAGCADYFSRSDFPSGSGRKTRYRMSLSMFAHKCGVRPAVMTTSPETTCRFAPPSILAPV